VFLVYDDDLLSSMCI